MNRKQCMMFLPIIGLLITVLLTGCGPDYVLVTPTPSAEQEQTETVEEVPSFNETKIEDDSEEVSLPIDSEISFIFTSGVGGWRTIVTVYPDGSFEGNYIDSESGDSSNGYVPIRNVCDFSGTFGDIKQMSDHTYHMKVTSITQEVPTGKEDLVEETNANGDSYVVHYVYSDPYGMTGVGGDFLFCLPDGYVSEYPKHMLGWLLQNGSFKSSEYLPFYVLYNVDDEFAMYSSDDAY